MANPPDESDAPGGARFPFIPLKQALERARVLHKNGAGHAIPVGELAGLWGYSEKASGWRQTTASLVYYGLSHAAGVKDDRRLRLTDDARRYFLDERPEEHEKLHAQFALTPPAFIPLWRLWGANPPSDSIARSILKTQFRYQENSAALLLSIYKANLAFANLATRSQDPLSGNDEPPISENSFRSSAPSALPASAAMGRAEGISSNSAVHVAVPHGGRTRPMENERELTTGMLSKEANFRLIVSGKIGAREIDRLIRKLQVDKEILANSDFEERETLEDGTPVSSS